MASNLLDASPGGSSPEGLAPDAVVSGVEETGWSLPTGAMPQRAASSAALLLRARLLGDAGGLLLGLIVAFALARDLAGRNLEPNGILPFTMLAVPAWLVLFSISGLYDGRKLLSGLDEGRLILKSVSVGTIVATFLAALVDVPTPRSWVLGTWIVCTVTVGVTRWLYRRILRSLARDGVLATRLLVVGAGVEGQELAATVNKSPWLGFQLVGFLDDAVPVGTPVATFGSVLGGAHDVCAVARNYGAGAVLVAGGCVPARTIEDVYRAVRDAPIDLHVSTGLPGVAASRVAVQRFGEIPVLGLRRVDLSGSQQVLKRAADITGAALGLLVASPVLVLCALAVAVSSRGPVVFCQERVGRDGKRFVVHKFRSMTADAEHQLIDLVERNESDGPLFKLAADPRVTPVGRVLRAWSLDELPQLFDVLRGAMSLVGPRPPLPSEVAAGGAWMQDRLRVRPGMTGLWQVSGRHRLSFSDYVRYDVFYVENWSLVMDLLILLRTVPAVLGRTGV